MSNAHVNPVMVAAFQWFAPPAHSITRDTEGVGLSAVHTPTCSCGWRGRPVPESSDFMSTELANQENQHRYSCASVEDMRKEARL